MPELVYWNPWRRLRPGGKLYRVVLPQRMNNFGDLLGPWIVNRICRMHKLGRSASDRRLLSVGSIINILAKDGDVIWGSGIHGNNLPVANPFPRLDIRAVRGPLSAAILRETGNRVPDIYGDPALLIPHLWTDSELGITRGANGTLFVPNYVDLPAAPRGALDPRGNVRSKIKAIASASRVIANSLHGIIIAEAYGVPATLVASGSERLFKYEDYYQGTGRSLPHVATSWAEALEAPSAPSISNWDAETLVKAFPFDLWEASASSS